MKKLFIINSDYSTGGAAYIARSLYLYAKEKLIESLQLIGATRFFVKAPFIIEGVLLGFIGSILSCALLIGALEFSNDLIYSFLSFEIYYDMNLLILILCSISI